MRLRLLLSASVFIASATAQNYYVPDPNPVSTTNSCNVIPFGSTTATWENQRYQTKVTAADLGNIPNLITGLGFSPCGDGVTHYDTLEVIIDHHPAGVPLSTTFDNNLTPNAVTVLTATNYEWHRTEDVWTEIGLQRIFVFNGVDDLVIQVWTSGAFASGSGSSAFNRETRQRVYNYNNPFSPTGSSGNAALKMEVGMIMARTSTYGLSCPGTSGTPSHLLNGSPVAGGIVNLEVTGGPANQIAILVFGFVNRPPFPFDLTPLGMPGCFQYFDVLAQTATVTDPSGFATMPFPIPNTTDFHTAKFYTQYALLDPGVNAASATTTNYGRMIIGN